MISTPTKTLLVTEDLLTEERDSLDIALEAAREHARRLTEMQGVEAPEVAVAWDTVEELMTAKRNRRAAAKTTFQTYCELNPEAPECRVYDV